MSFFVVVDTNVLVSAMLKWDSIPGNIINLVFNNVLIPLYNKEIIDEYKNVLSRKKFNFPSEVINPIIKTIMDNGVFINADKTDLFFIDKKDAVFYEVLMEKKKGDNAYLITGNQKHFPSESFILTPREMLDLVINELEK